MTGVQTCALPISSPEVAVDFTQPHVAFETVKACLDSGVHAVVGTTGLGPDVVAAVHAASKKAPVVRSANMSVGVNVFMDLVARAAVALGEDYDVEIAEAHHRQKVDAPSGTALDLGERVDQEAQTLSGANPVLYDLYLKRIAHFSAHPPAPDWNGVFL